MKGMIMSEPNVEDVSVQEEISARLNKESQKPLTERQFRELRGKYFTIRHPRVKPCNHHLDQINEPTFRNCESCWFMFFNSHGPLVEVTDKAFQEQGPAFLDKMRGIKYRKAFTSFMSTVARMKRENDEQQSREIQSGGSLGESDGQSERRVDNLSTTGEQGESTDPVDSEQSNIVR
jgi:hypothetical protein